MEEIVEGIDLSKDTTNYSSGQFKVDQHDRTMKDGRMSNDIARLFIVQWLNGWKGNWIKPRNQHAERKMDRRERGKRDLITCSLPNLTEGVNQRHTITFWGEITEKSWFNVAATQQLRNWSHIRGGGGGNLIRLLKCSVFSLLGGFKRRFVLKMALAKENAQNLNAARQSHFTSRKQR